MPTPVVLCMLWNVKLKLIVRLMLKPVLNLGTMESTAIPINIKDSTMDTLMVKDILCLPTPDILPLRTLYSYDPKEHVAQMNIEGWQFQRIFKHIGQKCSKWTYRVLLSLRYWQVMFNKNPFLLLKWSKNSKIILNPVIIAVLKSLFPCFLIYIFCNFENLINV